MTSKIKVDNINKVSDDSNIINKCGTTITLGASGDSIALASGASQTGFGSTGGISWQTSIKTTDFTAVSNEGYFVNTTGGAITVTLPASPSAGNVVAIKDYARTFGTNKVIVARNGSNMDGNADNTDLTNNGDSVVLVFMDATKGWSFINEDTTTGAGASFIVATGGNTVATCGNFKIHTFTGPGTFCVSATGNAAGSNTVSYVVAAGGGGAGGSNHGGGGGAGGYREGLGLNDSFTGSPLRAPTGVPVTAQGYPITVGAGGTGGAPPTTTVTNGSNSIFSTITSAGGGYGGSPNTPAPFGPDTAGNGGSGGGAYYNAPAGTGNTPPTTPPQGNNGGSSSPTPNWGSGGGGGATAVGGNGSGSTAGNGGAGATSSINATPTARAGGGGGGVYGSGTAGTGGTGGGGAGAVGPGTGTAGTTNTGGGGGAGAGSGPGPASGVGGAGGSGIVIIRYKFQ